MKTRLHSIPSVPDPKIPPQTRGRTLDYAAPVYDWLSNVMSLGFERRLNKKVAKFLNIQSGDLILDVGCATGNAALAAAPFCGREAGGVIGIDAAPSMIIKARTKARNTPCRFDIGLAESLPYSNETFEKATSTFFFHHLNAEDKSKALNEIWRVLKPSGVLVLCDLDVPYNLFGKIYGRVAESFFRQPEIGENLDGLFKERLRKSPFRNLTLLGQYTGCFSIYRMEK